MKKLYLLIFISFITILKGYSQTPFTAGNLVVYTIGNGVDTLLTSAFPVTLNEYTTTGAFVAAHPLPVAVSGSNRRIVASGTATSEGQMTRSADTKYLMVTGYDTFPAPTLAGSKVASSTASAVNRVVGIIDAGGNIDATTALTDAYSGSNIRGVASTNGTDIWLAGTGSASGVRYTTKGSTTSASVSSSITNIRTVNIFNGQLYSSSSSTTFLGVCQDGTGLPTTSGQTISLLPGFPATNSPSTYAFSIKPGTGDVLYDADDNSIAGGGGIQKWTFNGTTWTLVYTLKPDTISGARGLVVDWSDPNPIIYAVTAHTLTNSVVKIIDTGDSTVAFTTLASSQPDVYIFRGIAFAPLSVTTPVTLIDFKASALASAVRLQWSTSQEINTKDFTIERSTDGIHFTVMNKVLSAGNSSSLRKYEVTDKTPVQGINYYRLKTTDIDGKVSYSAIRIIKFKQNLFSIYPNPVLDHVTITHPVSTRAVLLVTDIQGRRIKLVTIDPGTTTSDIRLNDLSKGQYILKYVDTDDTITQMITKE